MMVNAEDLGRIHKTFDGETQSSRANYVPKNMTHLARVERANKVDDGASLGDDLKGTLSEGIQLMDTNRASAEAQSTRLEGGGGVITHTG